MNINITLATSTTYINKLDWTVLLQQLFVRPIDHGRLRQGAGVQPPFTGRERSTHLAVCLLADINMYASYIIVYIAQCRDTYTLLSVLYPNAVKFVFMYLIVCVHYRHHMPTDVCNNTGVDFVLRPGSQYCYRLWQIDEDFFEANKSCSRNNAALVRIDSQEENDYINSTYFVQLGYQEFWIGLTDIFEEGVFRYTIHDYVHVCE